MKKPSRRSFLFESGAGLSAVWLASNWPAILQAREAAASGQLVFFTPDQAAVIDAMASQIIPTDDTPGAHEARCVYFIDRGLTTFFHDSQPVYAQGFKDLQQFTQEISPGASLFSALTSKQQIQILTSIEKTPFFRTVRNHTIIGMFSSPAHGGNYDQAGWKLIGFEDTLNFKPPFGYYDAVSKPGR
jgi:gluconate 2-dehydrogenase gamma chain